MSVIKVFQHEMQPLSWWFEQFNLDRLDLAPKYQRRSELWSSYKRGHLIDSVLNDFDIPKLYVADFNLARSELNQAKKPYAVVDGKQRFEAFFSFFQNKFPINQSTLLDASPEVLVRGKYFKDLQKEHPELAKKIFEFVPVVMSITTDDDSKIYEMFVRLNSGEAANGAERRNAKPGPIPVLVRDLVEHAFFSSRIGFTKKRMQDFNLAAKMLLIEHRRMLVDTKAGNLDRFVAEAAAETTPNGFEREPTAEQVKSARSYESTRDRVIEVLESMSEAFKPNDPLLKNAGRIPVYYWILRQHKGVAPNFRDFVAEFEAKALEAMRNDRDRLPQFEGAKKYLTYYTLARTTNDQKSLVIRFELLEEGLFKKHLISKVSSV